MPTPPQVSPWHPRVHPGAQPPVGTPSTQRHPTPTQLTRSPAPKGAPQRPPAERDPQFPKAPNAHPTHAIPGTQGCTPVPTHPNGVLAPKGAPQPPTDPHPSLMPTHPIGTPSTQTHPTPTQLTRSPAPKGAPRCPPTPMGSRHPKVPPPPIPTHPHTPPCRVLAERQRHVEEDQQVADSKHRQILRRGAAQLVLQGALQGGMELRGTPAPMGAPKTPP